jgi:hypothetical protein
VAGKSLLFSGGLSAGAFTEMSYKKVCADKIEELRTWVRRHGRRDGSFSRECSLCNPVT